MAKRIILLSGPVAAGKTRLGNALVERYEFKAIKTRKLIESLVQVPNERGALQKAGEQLDQETQGQWVAEALAREVSRLPENCSVLVDSIRIGQQAEAIRVAFGARVVHIHLTAPPNVLSERYGSRTPNVKELPSYDQVRADPTESAVEKLADIADIVIDTKQNSASDVLVRAATRLGLYGRSVERLVDVLIGGQYGSEGKGHVAAYLAPEYDYLIRVGGPNAGHTVYEVPKPYKFHQLPSGSRCSEAGLIIGPGAVIWVPQLQKEIAECEVAPNRLSIDPQAMIICDEDRAFEKKTLEPEIGSTAQGVGAATARKILRTAAHPQTQLARDIPEFAPYIKPSLEVLESAFSQAARVFVEGTQGTGLSIHHGIYPFVTSRETSGSGCLAEAGIAPSRVRKTIMAVRTYPIRVEGNSGPMENELNWHIISDRSGIPVDELLAAERTTTTDKKRRVAEFDWNLLRKAASLNGPTDIALTFADYITVENRKARRFEQLSEPTIRLVEEIERVASAPVSLITTRFDARSIIDRRAW
jgi:adenylosuccinate synthase